MFAGPIVNTQSFLVVVWHTLSPTEVKQTVARIGAAMIQLNGAAETNGLGEHSANSRHQTSDLGAIEFVGAKAGRDPSEEERLARVDVSDTRHQRLIEQFDFDTLTGAFQFTL
jgi:hypothetical protein